MNKTSNRGRVLFFIGTLVINLSACKQDRLEGKTHIGLSTKINQLVQRYVSDQTFVGVQVLVIEKETTIINALAGFSKIREKEPISAETVFALGSNTKMLTSASILLLQQNQQIELDDLAENS